MQYRIYMRNSECIGLCLAADIQRIHAQVNADINVQIQKQKTHIAMHQVRTH